MKGNKAAGAVAAVKDGFGCFYSFKQNNSSNSIPMKGLQQRGFALRQINNIPNWLTDTS